jgi:hypothetical protein
MTADLEALVVAAYVFADEYPVPARPGRPAQVTDAELVALAVCQAAMGISSDRQFLGLVGRVLPGWFPHLPSQSQYNRRLGALVELIAAVQQRLACWLDSGQVRLADGTLLRCANYPGCVQRSAFAGFASYGYAKSQHASCGECGLSSSLTHGCAARLHARPRQREGVRAARRSLDRHSERGRDRRPGAVGARERRRQPDALLVAALVAGHLHAAVRDPDLVPCAG